MPSLLTHHAVSRRQFLRVGSSLLALPWLESLAGAAAAHEPDAAAKDDVAAATAALDPPHFRLDYLAVVDEDTFVPEDDLGPRSRLIVAARLGTTRLIDTISVASAYPAKDATA